MTDLSHFAQLLVNILAVGGGFLAGYWLTMFAAWGVDALTRRKSSRGLHKALRFLGGLLGGILVALIVFGHGRGWNLFGGAAPGTGTHDGQADVQPISTPVKSDNTDNPVTTPAENVGRIRITLLGGLDVREKRFYKLNDEAAPLTLDEVQKRVRTLTDAASAKPGVDVVFTKQNRLPQDHPAVLQLTQWLRNVAGLAVTFPPDPR